MSGSNRLSGSWRSRFSRRTLKAEIRPMNEFSYSPLNHEINEIRLLTLQPGLFGDPLVGQLSTVAFVDNPEYEALSYEWGTSEPSHHILIDGKKKFIRDNLCDALLNMRYVNQPRILWADALCINQENDLERTHQVKQMGDIYKNARDVLIWLGHAADDSDFGFAAMNMTPYFGGMPASQREDLNTEWDAQWDNGEHIDARAWRAIDNICRRTYWKRMWIIQEVGLPTSLKLYCGRSSTQWQNFAHILDVACREAWNNKTNPRCLDIAQSLPARIAIRRGSDSSLAKPLLDLLDFSKDCLCSDPRDKIYALLSLATDCQQGEIVPDYSKATVEVYRDVMVFHKQKNSGASALDQLSQLLKRFAALSI